MIINSVGENFSNRWLKFSIESFKLHAFYFTCLFLFIVNIGMTTFASLYFIFGIFCGILTLRVLQESRKKNLTIDDYLDILFKNPKACLSAVFDNKLFYFIMLGFVLLIDLKFQTFQKSTLILNFSLITIFAFNSIQISNFSVFKFMLNYDLNINQENREALIQQAISKNAHVRQYFSISILLLTIASILMPLLAPIAFIIVMSQTHCCYTEIFFDPKEIEKQKNLIGNIS